MRYAQIKSGQKLHLVYEPGEGKDDNNLIRKGFLSAPLCSTRWFNGSYRMTINLPMGHGCRNCYRVWDGRAKI